MLDVPAARVAARRTITARRRALADSGLTDPGTRATIYLLDRVRIKSGTSSIIASLAHLAPSLNRACRCQVDAVLTMVLDGVDGGTIRTLDDFQYSLS